MEVTEERDGALVVLPLLGKLSVEVGEAQRGRDQSIPTEQADQWTHLVREPYFLVLRSQHLVY